MKNQVKMNKKNSHHMRMMSIKKMIMTQVKMTCHMRMMSIKVMMKTQVKVEQNHQVKMKL
jgi:hypothetical protein